MILLLHVCLSFPHGVCLADFLRPRSADQQEGAGEETQEAKEVPMQNPLRGVGLSRIFNTIFKRGEWEERIGTKDEEWGASADRLWNRSVQWWVTAFFCPQRMCIFPALNLVVLLTVIPCSSEIQHNIFHNISPETFIRKHSHIHAP